MVEYHWIYYPSHIECSFMEKIKMNKKKLPYVIRLVRYWFNCLWYYVLFPLGAEEDDFTKSIKKKDYKN